VRFLARDEDVRRLQVPVDDAVRVRMRHGPQDGHEETQPPADVQPLEVAVLRQRLSVDVFHDEVRAAVHVCARFEHGRDARMVQGSEDLPFGPEPREHVLRVDTAAQELHRDEIPERRVVALREEHRAHPSASEAADHAVWPHPLRERFPRRPILEGRPDEVGGRTGGEG